MKSLSVMFCVCLMTGLHATLFAQRGIVFSSTISRRVRFVPEGTRITCSYIRPSDPVVLVYTRYGAYPRARLARGNFKIENDSTIRVNNDVIPLREVTAIKKSEPGAWVLPVTLLTGGFAMMIASKHVDPTTYEVTHDDGLLYTGAAAAVVGYGLLFSNLPRNTSVWHLSIGPDPHPVTAH